jgi:iron complex outermembrane recepter protein
MGQKNPWALGITVLVSAGIGALGAQEQDKSLDEVLVTAQKRTERVQDVPISLTVVDSEQLAQQQIYNIEDLARTTPSLEMVQAFGGPGGGGQVRGIGTQSFTPTAEGAVGIVVDGVPQGNANTSNIFDMERVEVLRGPQGTLFGLTTSAGVINMTTRAPKIGELETNFHVDFANDGTAGSEYGRTTVRGVVNVPINDSQALRVAASYDQVEGVQTNTFKQEDSELKDYSARVRYLLKAGDNVEMNLIADFARRSQNYSEPSFNYVFANPALTTALAACGITPSFANNLRCGRQLEESGSDNLGLSAQFDIGMGDFTLTSITGYRKVEAGPNSFDIKGLHTEATQIFSVGALNDSRQMSQELRLTSPAGQRLEYVTGVFYSDFLAEGGVEPGGAFNVTVRLPFPPFATINPVRSARDTETTNRSIAAFGQGSFHATDALSLIAGLRFTHQKIETSASADLYAPTTTVPTFGEVSEDDVSGKLGLQYRFGPNLMSYATVTRGYKGPQVSPAAEGVEATIIEAEKPLAYELGVKGSVLEGRLGLDLSLFHTDVKNFQGQRCGINAVGVLACIGESIPSVTTKGVELGLYGSPLPGLTLNGGYIYNIARYPSGWTGYDPNNLSGGTTDLSNEQLVNVPENKFSFAGDYTRQIGGVLGFVSMDAVYKSEIRYGPTADERFVYPSHWLLGARIGVRSQSGAWGVSLFGRNLTNENEPITLFGGPSFTAPNPAGSTPEARNGFVNGVSGIMTAASQRQVGISVDVTF